MSAPGREPARALGMLRAYRGISQRSLAEQAGVNKGTVSGYERGRLAIGPANLEALLAALGVSGRGWDATVRHVQWMDHLEASADARDPEALRLAEQVSRDFEIGALAMLRLLVALAEREAAS